MYYFRDDVHTTQNMGIHNCAYADSADTGYSEFALFDGGDTIKDVQAVSGNQTMELAKELTNWKD